MNVTIEKLVYGGEGLAHSEGQTVFVPYVLPGEVVAVRPVERKRKFVRAQLQHVLTPAAERAAPECPHFAACGGCHYQHMAYPQQIAVKQQILRETLGRLGRVPWEGAIHAHPSPPFGYRNRAQWKVRVHDGRGAIGYFRSGSSALLAVQCCPILSPGLERALAALRTLLSEGRLPQTLREVEIFADERDERLLLNASCTEFAGSPAAFAETLRAAMPGAESILLHESSRDRFELFGPGHITYRAAGAEFRVGHLSFFQVNRHLVDQMAATVAQQAGAGRALDLYAGVGLFSVPLARNCERLVAVESNEAAVRDLQANLEPAGAQAQAVCADAERYLAGVTEPPDVVVLDPPRAGVQPGALRELLRIAPQRIVYLSCDPATLARDLGVLVGGGAHAVGAYEIAAMHLFDVFPQTYHIETMVHMSRKS
jgi:23S rRNA (uracil1939-C5)-methyltransferase